MTYSSLGRAAWSRTTSSRDISAVPSPSGSCPWYVDAGGVEPPAPCLSRRCAAVAPRVGCFSAAGTRAEDVPLRWVIRSGPEALVVPGVFEPPPAGFQPAAPPSELRDCCAFRRSRGTTGVPQERHRHASRRPDRTGSLSGTGRASSLQDLAGGFGSTGVHLRQTGVENERRTAGGCGQVPL